MICVTSDRRSSAAKIGGTTVYSAPTPLMVVEKLIRAGVTDDLVRVRMRDETYLEYPSLALALAGLAVAPARELAAAAGRSADPQI
jgi:hypothetical protein